MWVSLQLEVPLAQSPRTNPTKVRKIRRVDLDRKVPGALAAFYDALRNCISLHTPDPADPTALGLLLEDICVTSTNATRLTLKPLMRRNKFHRDGWSPTYNVMAQQTRALTEIKRRLLGQHGRHRWRTDAAIHDGIRDIIQSWTTSAAAYRWRSAAELNDLLNCTGNAPDSWFNRVPTPHEIDIECAAVARKMQGRTRREIRALVSEANAKKEQDRVNHKFKRLIRAITAKAINPYTMETLQHPDGTMSSEPSEIHHVLTTWFQKWFQYDRDISSTLHEDNKWQEFLHDRAQFDLLLLNTSIEPDIRDILWQALHVTALRLTNSDREELESLMTTPPDYATFKARLTWGKGGVTGGVTGCTYTMMAEWPEEVIRTVYDTLILLDSSDHTPEYWKRKWLVPMPKTPDPSPKDLRPLMLVETLRKVWCGFAVTKVWKFLEERHLLESTQFAYRKKHEAGIAQLQLTNAIEEAAESGSSIYVSSFDLVHAFDSISHNIIKLSLASLGMSDAAAHKMVNIEAGSSVTVRTPLAHAHWATKLAHTTRQRRDSARIKLTAPPAFIPERGTPQGDTASCLHWTAFENIFLAALRVDTTRAKLYVRGPDDEIFETIDICYADDLITISPDLPGMQRKAQIVGQLAEVCHLQISTPKLRTVGVQYGQEGTPPANPSIQLNDGTGRIHTVPVPIANDFKHLGYTPTIAKTNKRADLNQFIRTKAMLNNVCNTIIKKSASPLCKLIALQSSVLNSALWQAQA